MRLLIKLLLLLVATAAGKKNSNVYNVALDGEAKHKLYWALDYPNAKIQFEVHAKVNEGEWFAVGFSHHGDFEIGDYCVYLPTENGPILQGVWTDDKCIAHPFPKGDDICSRFEYVEGDDHIKYTYTRPFERCTDNHYQIEDGTTHIIWSRGSGHLIGKSLCRRKEQGMTRVQLLKTEGVGAPHPPSTWLYNPHVENVKVPSTDTTYWCQTVKLPEQLKRRNHVIQAESSLTKGNEGVVHHMEFFHCEVPHDTIIPSYSGPCDQKPKALQPCAKVIAAWAMGATPFVYPKEAGLPVGGPNYTMYAMLEIHYNNPLQLANWVDSSGFNIYMTPDLRKYDAGIMELGLEYVDKMALPPHQRLWTLSGYCISECTTVALPERGIMVFGSQLHTHLTGVMVETRHIRQGKEMDLLNYDYHYSPHFQEIRLLKKQRRVLPGDALIQTCYYDTTSRNNVTITGFKTTDEMCVSYNYYYPKIDLEVCKSSISDDVLGEYFDNMSLLENQETGSGLPISESYSNIVWNPIRVKVLDELYRNRAIYMQCNNSAGHRYPGDWSNMPLTIVNVPENRKATKCYDEVEVYPFRFEKNGKFGSMKSRRQPSPRGTWML